MALVRSLILQLASANFDHARDKFNPSIKSLLVRLGLDGTGSAVTKIVRYLGDDFVRDTPGNGRNNRALFSSTLRETSDLWNAVKDSEPWRGLKIIRDQFLAQTDLSFIDGVADTIDIAGVGLTFGNLCTVHEKTQDLVKRVHGIITGKIPDYDPSNKRGRLAAENFWRTKFR